MDSTNTQPKNRSFHTLRTTSLLLWIPTLAFCLPHGIIAHVLFPVLGIIPMTFSALLALLHLSKRTQPARSVSVLLDILCACSLIAVLVPSWVSLARGSRNFYWDRPLSGITMIGTYATGVMMVNFVIHVFLSLRHLGDLRNGLFTAKTCPHCHAEITRSSLRRHQGAEYSGLLAADAGDSGKEYFQDTMTEELPGASSSAAKKYRPEDREPRPSTDDEAARLV